MVEGDFVMAGVTGGFSFLDLIYTFEIDQTENLISDLTSFAMYDQISWTIIQGFDMIVKYDFFDPDKNYKSNAISRYSVGLEIYPLNIMEVKLQTRINQIHEENTSFMKPEYLIQTHFWF